MPTPGLMNENFPGVGPNASYVVGMSNVGYSVIDATIVANTARTDAQLIASPPNTGSAFAVGPVVHSLGVPPAMVQILALGNSIGAITFSLVTADNSAVYLAANAYTAQGAQGVRVRVYAMR